MEHEHTPSQEAFSVGAAVPASRRERFFRPVDWLAFGVATLLSFAVYGYTLAPTVTLEDSGELAVGGDWAGVPHPPGYPVWTLCAWVFCRIFQFVPYRGQPNPAWAIGLMSAFFGALATGITAMLICRSGSDLLRGTRRLAPAEETDAWAIPIVSPRLENAIGCIGGVVASLLFAFTNVMWSQAVIVEIYTLNAFFLMMLFLLTYRWMHDPRDIWLYWTGFIFGLSLAHYYVLLLALLPLAILVFLKDLRLFRDFSLTALPFAVVITMMKLGTLPFIRHPTDITCGVYLTLNFFILLYAYFFLPRGRTVALTILLAELGFAFYAYMPLASDFRNPPINWGYPRTWQGFLHAVGRGQYERIVPTNVLSLRFLQQVMDYFIDLRRQFTIGPEMLGFLPFAGWTIMVTGRRVGALVGALMVTAITVVLAMVEKFGLSPDRSIALSLFGEWVEIYKIGMAAVLILALIGFLTMVMEQAGELAGRLRPRRGNASLSDRVIIVLAGLGLLAAYGVFVARLGHNVAAIVSSFTQPGALSEAGQVSVAVRKIVGLVALMLLPPILAVLFGLLPRTRWKVTTLMDSNAQKWLLAVMAGFLALSVALIAFANPRGDIQDAFIQKVKFIGSHGLFAMWIGYGLILLLAQANTLFRRWGLERFTPVLLTGSVLLVGIPFLVNAFDSEMLRIYGGAEQNGHDFGWQFGNYQLRGADAIWEERTPEEEPLPNPAYPPAMTTNAIFYGGTDPGRFVPTYMIYSARVREDVYLITQNALADHTYMSVMRDLYGDRIWIPSPPESQSAFQRYVNEVRTGKRPRNAELTFEEGRVQVSGALGVMEINGILAQMIFERNNWRHDFYVEESYVIPWMYPHLTPHGLIMKINRHPVPLSDDILRQDLDFWDWYQRRLNSNRKFIRDIVARKSFSKLRSAIAGLYANRGLFPQAETAFQEARLLYPLSPEANFRLVQEVLLRMNRLSECRQVISAFHRQDPGNDKIPPFLEQLKRIERLSSNIEELERELAMQKGRVDIGKAIRLAGLYQEAGRMAPFLQLAGQLLANTNLPPVFHFHLAQLYARVNRTAEMSIALDLCQRHLPSNLNPEIYIEMARMYALSRDQTAMQKMLAVLEQYLNRRPDDWKAWLDMSSVAHVLNRMDEATRALREALRRGGREAESLVQQNPRLVSLLPRLAPRPALPLSLPGLEPGLPTPDLPPLIRPSLPPRTPRGTFAPTPPPP